MYAYVEMSQRKPLYSYYVLIKIKKKKKTERMFSAEAIKKIFSILVGWYPWMHNN
jgi:hypothetical protein